MPSRHPFIDTRWIWPEAYMYLHNHFAQFRRDFELPAIGKKALLHITADKSYKLFVNGQFVCRGPARGYQSHWPYDSVDLRPYLRNGHNWISVEAYNPGISTFSYLHQTRAGLLAAVEGREIAQAWKASQWQYRRSPAHKSHVARASLQIDFQEHVDLRLDDRSWIAGAKAPTNWHAGIFPDRAHNYLGQPFGTPPYVSVEPRGIPLMREWVRAPKRVLRYAEGDCAPRYAEAENASWLWCEEFSRISQFHSGDGIVDSITDDAMTLHINPVGPGRYAAIFIDAGEFAAANLIVEVSGAAGGEILDFQHDQLDEHRNNALVPPGEGCNAAMCNRMTLREGANQHEFYSLMGFQHLTIIARDVRQALQVKISLRCAGYPFSFAGRFDSSDATLNDIHKACQRTQQLCSWDAYMDTPWREQAQWWGDARVQARNTFYMDGDARLLARGIRSIAGQVSLQGLTYGHAPTSSDWCILPDFALTWIMTLWDYYFQTGDISLFVEQQSVVEGVLGYFETAEARGALGLLQYDARFWLFEDWSTLPKQLYPAFLNLWHLFTVEHVARMCAVAGQKKRSAELNRVAQRQHGLIIRHFVDKKTGLVRPCLDRKGRREGEPSVHDQTLAMMLRLSADAHDKMIQQVLLPYLRGEAIPGAKASAFWSFYVLEEMGRRGFARECTQFIRRHWAPMLLTGTTWESFDSIKHPGSSTCHAWTAHPAVHFVNMLAGVRQESPGWKQITFAPVFVREIDHVNAVVPSPKGPIRARWQRGDGRVTGELALPAGVSASICVPGVAPRKQTGGRFRFSSAVR